MSYTIAAQFDQPIMTVTYHGTVNAKELAEAQQAVMEKGYEFGPNIKRIFCIQDIRDANVNFVDGIIHNKQVMLYTQRKTQQADVEVNLIFVGMNRAAKAFIQLRQMVPSSQFRISAVNDMDEAMALIQREMAT
jgi:hypothetical protein